MGDMGAALFHPLNYDDEQHVDEQCGDEDDHGTRLTTASVDELAAADMHNVQVMPTHDDIPFLLSISSMNMIVNSLPWTLHSRKWVRLYSCLKDGDSFPAFLYHVRGHTRTLLVLETSKGEVFGGFADASVVRVVVFDTCVLSFTSLCQYVHYHRYEFQDTFCYVLLQVSY